jgi:hypothetical protein
MDWSLWCQHDFDRRPQTGGAADLGLRVLQSIRPVPKRPIAGEGIHTGTEDLMMSTSEGWLRPKEAIRQRCKRGPFPSPIREFD